MDEAVAAQRQATLNDIDAFVSDGGERFDAAGVRLVRGLLTRMNMTPEIAHRRILHRAKAHLARQRARLDEVRRGLEDVAAERESTEPEWARQVRVLASRGDIDGARRMVRRRSRRGPRANRRATGLRERIEAHITAVGIEAPVMEDDAKASPLELSQRLYLDAAAEAEARMAVPKASQKLPEGAGRYHGDTVAAHAFEALALFGRGYVKAHIRRYEAFGALMALADALDVPVLPPRKRRGR